MSNLVHRKGWAMRCPCQLGYTATYYDGTCANLCVLSIVLQMEGYAESATDIEGLIQKTEVVGSVSTSPDHSLRLAAQCMHPICLRAHIGGAVLQGEHFQGET